MPVAGVVPNVSQVYATHRVKLSDKCTNMERGLLRPVSIRIPPVFPWLDREECIRSPSPRA